MMAKVSSESLVLLLLSACCILHESIALGNVAERSQLARSRLQEALASPSGKLTLSPELIIPEPTDPTAILLQTSALQTLSATIRESKANAAFVRGSPSAVQTLLSEQEQARGHFPGPVPIVYCHSNDDECTDETLQALSEAGAAGLSVAMEMDSFGEHVEVCKRIIACGLQPIPEVVIDEEVVASWAEDDVISLVETISSTLDMEPVSVLFTIKPTADATSDEQEDEPTPVALPPISKALSKKLPILGSISVPGGIAVETARFKDAGFTGAVLRASCLPQFRTPDVEPVGRYWGACISDLKSTRSKSFSFRAKNKMEKSVISEWAKYSQDVVESGAIGEFGQDASEIDTEAGDYQGF